jgi:molecular chaperone GrpE
MFFKKKKIMSDSQKENMASENGSADNLSDETVMDENMTNSADAAETTTQNTETGDKLQAELNELKDKHLRLIAEFDNFRRRMAKERIELGQTAGREIISALLTVLDDMDRAGKQLDAATDIAVIKEGVTLVFNKMRNVMQQKGLKMMEVGNADFDPDLHEAITEIPAPTEALSGKVIDVVESGYYLNDKLIRHAKVVVGK